MTRPRSPLARLFALIRGGFASFVREREERSPKAVYEQAILERQRHYAELKRAVAGILYMRNKLDGEIAKATDVLVTAIGGSLHAPGMYALRHGTPITIASIAHLIGWVTILEVEEP